MLNKTDTDIRIMTELRIQLDNLQNKINIFNHPFMINFGKSLEKSSFNERKFRLCSP